MTAPTPDTSPGDELSADEILRRFRQHCMHGIMSDTPWTMDFTEAKDRLNRLMLTRERELLKRLSIRVNGHVGRDDPLTKDMNTALGWALKDIDLAVAAIDAQLNKEEK